MPADSAESPPPASDAAAQTTKPVHPESNIKETIESILVAFILAFVFRAFVVEAFVIPTGSMAPTLMGAHMRYRCPDCGYRWDVNFSTGSADDINIPAWGQWVVGVRPGTNTPIISDVVPRPLHCPNCGFPVRQSDPDDPDNDLTAPPIHYGDRILVLKYLYLFEKPHRWDVVVFKNPSESTQKPNEPQYAQNYIKRLVGNPGEVIVILDGDVYVGPGPLPEDARRPDGSIDPMRVDWSRFHVQAKPWYVQEALWRNVYDNDYLPHLPRDSSGVTSESQLEWRQPWQEKAPGSGWQTGKTRDDKSGRSRVFTFDNLSGSSELYFDHTAIPGTHALTDHLAYDELDEQSRSWRRNPVGDLKLSLYYTRNEGDGPLDLQLTKDGETFTARVTRGQVSLLRSRGGAAPEPLQGPVEVADLRSGKPVRLEFCNVDYRVALRVNGSEVAATAEAEYAPDVAELVRERAHESTLPAVRIAAAGQRCAVEHLTLSRDVYYLNSYSWGQGNALWGDAEKPIELGKDEYFVLGDNSFISGDARTWTRSDQAINLPDEALQVREGRVPGRFMLGKAFFVYWPAGYRPTSRLSFGLIPNFGDMRFIH